MESHLLFLEQPGILPDGAELKFSVHFRLLSACFGQQKRGKCAAADNPCRRPFGQKKKTRREMRRVCEKPAMGGAAVLGPPAHFCHVRFLWRFAFKRFR
ncbi:MAG: hypothetical protein V4773_09160, partial [Verrucomicrobiota bacterium]